MPKKTFVFRIVTNTILLLVTLFVVIALAYATDTGTQAGAQSQDNITEWHPEISAAQAVSSTPEATATSSPPSIPNDHFRYATEIIALPYTTSQPLAETTRDDGDPKPSCWSTYFTNTIWYRYTPTTDQRVMVDAVNSDDDTNPQLAVFRDVDGNLSEQGCSVRAREKGIDLLLSVGETYYIMGAMYGWTPATTEQFTLNVAVVPTVPNDEFSNALQVSALPFGFQQNIYAATRATSDPSVSCGSLSSFNTYRNSVWFQYTASADQTIIVNAKDSTFDAVIAVYSGNQSGLTEQVCNYAGANTLASFPAKAGVQYSILIAREGSQPLQVFGELVLNISFVAPAPNDDIANATLVSSVPFEQTIDVYGTNSAPTDPKLRESCLYSQPQMYPNTVWYRYVPSTTHSLNIATEGSGYRTLIGMYTLNGSALSEYACSGDRFLSTTVQAGVTYYVMIASADNYDRLPIDHSALLHVRFNLPLVNNDLIQDATIVNAFPFSIEQNIYGSTISPDDPRGCTTNFQSNSVWFQYTPSQSQGVILDATASDYQAAIKIYTRGAGNTLVEQGCAFGSLGLQVQAGVSYSIMVSRRQDSALPVLLQTDKLRFHISTPLVANDLIENATPISAVPYSNTQDVFGSSITMNDPSITSGSCRSAIIYSLDRINTVWYQYTAQVTQTLLISTEDSDYPTFIELPDQGICGYGVRTFQAQAGTTYRIKIAYRNTDRLPMPLAQSALLHFVLRPTLANDTQTDAVAINTVPFSYSQDISTATVDAGESSGCGSQTQSVWFKYTPDRHRTVLIDTSGSNYNTVIALFIGSNRSGCAPVSNEPQQGKFTLNARAGYTYYIVIANHSETPASAPATLRLSVTDTTNSHAFENARVIPANALTYQDNQDLGNAKNDYQAPFVTCNSSSYSGYQNSLWYRYTPILDMNVTVSNVVTQSSIITNVYDADGLQFVTCSHGWEYRPASVTFNARAGKSYYIFVGMDTHLASGTDPWLNQLNFDATVSAYPIALSVSGMINTARPLFTWTPVVGAESYELTLASNGDAASTFTINSSGNCSETLCTFRLSNALALGHYQWNVVGWNSQLGYTLPSNALNFTVNDLIITAQPQSQTILGGQTATLSVAAAGSGTLSYQWYSGTPGDTSYPVGTNSTRFTTPALTMTTSYWVRVSNKLGYVDSSVATITTAENLGLNGNFSNGTSGWTFSSTTQNVTNGVLRFAPLNGSGGFMQSVPYATAPNQSYELLLDMGNYTNAKTVNVMVHSQDWSSNFNCVYLVPWLPNGAMQSYSLRFRTPTAFTPMVVQIWASGDASMALTLDNVVLRTAATSVTSTECSVSPPTNVNLVQGGDFSAGLGSWAPFNAQMRTVSPAGNPMMELARDASSTYGGFYQYMPFSAAANDKLEFTFQLGNNSSTNRVINMLLRDGDWLDTHSCFLNLPAFSPVTTYTMRVRTTIAWQNIVLQGWVQVGTYPTDPVYPFRFDNLELRSLPSLTVTSTDCPVVSSSLSAEALALTAEVTPELTAEAPVELTPEATSELTAEATIEVTTELTAEATALPTETLVALPTAQTFPTLEPLASSTPLPTAQTFPTLEPFASPTPLPTQFPLPLPASATMDFGVADWQASWGWSLTPQAAFGAQGYGWQVASVNTLEVLRWTQPLDLRGLPPGQPVHLTFQSLLHSQHSTAAVQLSLDGNTWSSIGTIAAAADWSLQTIDLSAYRGQVVQLQFVWQGATPAEGQSADVWVVDQVLVAAVAAAHPTEPALPTVLPTESIPVAPTLTPTEPPTALPTASLEVMPLPEVTAEATVSS